MEPVRSGPVVKARGRLKSLLIMRICPLSRPAARRMTAMFRVILLTVNLCPGFIVSKPRNP